MLHQSFLQALRRCQVMYNIELYFYSLCETLHLPFCNNFRSCRKWYGPQQMLLSCCRHYWTYDTITKIYSMSENLCSSMSAFLSTSPAQALWLFGESWRKPVPRNSTWQSIKPPYPTAWRRVVDGIRPCIFSVWCRRAPCSNTQQGLRL